MSENDPKPPPPPGSDPTVPPTLSPGQESLIEPTFVDGASATSGPSVTDPTLPLGFADSSDRRRRSGSRRRSDSSGPGDTVPSSGPVEGLVRGVEFGNYRLERQVGEGAQGQVWLGVNRIAKRPVALKFLSTKFAHDTRAMDSMRDEAAVLFDLTHEGIVRLMNIEQIEGHAFLVMEFLGGPSLANVVAQRRKAGDPRLTVNECLWVLERLAPALDFANRKNVTHRDIKPGNVMLTKPLGESGALEESGADVKLCDFGIAFVASGQADDAEQYTPTGTPPYMAPEVLSGQKPTPAADIYSLGATLYSLANGLPPYQGTYKEIRNKVALGSPPPLDSGNRTFDAAIARALSKDPAARPASADDLLYEASGKRLGRRAAQRQRGYWIAVAGSVALAAAAIVYVAWRFSTQARQAEFFAPAPGFVATTPLLDVRFRIDNADVDVVEVGFIGDEERPGAIRTVGRKADGYFDTTLEFPGQGKHTIQLRSGGDDYGSLEVELDSVLELGDPGQGSEAVRLLSPQPVEIETGLHIEFVAREPVRVRTDFGGQDRELELVFNSLGRATTLLEIPRRDESRTWREDVRFTFEDSHGNTGSETLSVECFDRAAVERRHEGEFPLTGSGWQAHELDRLAADFVRWKAEVEGDLLLSDQDRARLYGGERGQAIARLEGLREARGDVSVEWTPPDRGTLETDAGLTVIYTPDEVFTLRGRVLDLRSTNLRFQLEGEPEELRQIHPQTGEFTLQVTLGRNSARKLSVSLEGLADPVQLRLVQDSSAPRIQLADGNPESTRESSLRIAATIEDEGSSVREVTLVSDGEEWTLAPQGGPAQVWSAVVELREEGANRFSLVAKDLAGNSTSRVFEVERDTRSPQPVSGGGYGAGNFGTGASAKLRFEFDEPLATAAVTWEMLEAGARVEGGAFDVKPEGKACSITLDLPDLPATLLSVELLATDLVGNKGKATGSWTLTYDPWGDASAEIRDSAEIVPAAEFGELLGVEATSPSRTDPESNKRFPRLIRHRETGIEFVYVPSGEFTLGDANPSNEPDVLTPVTVRMSGFYLARTEVSGAQFMRLSTPNDFANKGYETSTLPIRIDWHVASAWCAKAGFQLPTEAQWEYAASGRDNLIFPWGLSHEAHRVNAQAGSKLGGSVLSANLIPVELMPEGRSWCSALQMSGNLSEVCRDDLTGVKVEDGSRDPVGAIDASPKAPRVLRGGSVNSRDELDLATFARAIDRNGITGRYNYGFRPVWSAAPVADR